jgi:hypothetical protein
MPKKEDVPALLVDWQIRLRLEDWDISVKFEKHCECLANARLKPNHKAAEIVLLETEFINPNGLGNKDLEVSLVHELLHIQAGHLTEHLCEKGNERYYDDMERVVELTAIALVGLRRRVDFWMRCGIGDASDER